MELPDDIKEALDLGEISYIYGMDWLKRNGNSLAKNKEIVDNNPFIPYSLVITKNNMERLKEQNLGIYTSFPIPIIIKEDLGKDFRDKSSSIYLGDKVNFYILFNENLLDEQELERILLSKEDAIKRIESAVEKREEDFGLYDDKYNQIKFQTINVKAYNHVKNNLITKLKIKEAYENELNTLRDEEHNLITFQEELNTTIQNIIKKLDESNRKYKDLSDLNREYLEYLDLRREKITIETNINKIKAEILSKKDENDKLKELFEKSNDSRREYQNKNESIKSKLQEYLRYEKRELIQKDIEDIKARYKALTSEIAGEVKYLEDAYANAKGRFSGYEKDLIKKAKRFNIEEYEYKNEIYDNFILETIEDKISEIMDEVRELNSKSSDLNAKKAVKQKEIDLGYKKLREELNQIDLVPRSKIILTEFKKRINQRRENLRKLRIYKEKISSKIGNFDNNLSSLAEYSDLTISKIITFDEDFMSMDREGLDRFKGLLLRDYRQIDQTLNKYRNQLRESLDKILRIKAFEDDFFNKPLNTLYSLIKDPVDFIEQLNTTIKAYDDLMAKLDVDIAIVEKEKLRVIEIFLEYIRDIHKNLSKIDKNSTIKIREKPLKMLRIELSDWETEENQYRNRLKDLIEELTQSGINRLENNENIEETIGAAITTNNLYNNVVGISNIRIKLYKIEAERQYQIDWSEVSKNSGGEGFLSAFVILSSLLSFMRRDETDIFAELEEGKVLIMDNPFAQTNSAHLLRPLMDVAKKSNTQLICFTGLGGESIYNCFDNIYVLNPISSNLRKGMQYLKSEHTKGEEIQVMETSQVKTEEIEQLDFLF